MHVAENRSLLRFPQPLALIFDNNWFLRYRAHGNLKRLTTGNQKWNLKDSCSWRAGFAAFGRPKNVELWMPT
jgi:hypothetical protein